MKTYVTFGQGHIHSVNGKTFDKDCVAIIETKTKEEGRKKAFEYFENKFCFEYFDKEFDQSTMSFFLEDL